MVSDRPPFFQYKLKKLTQEVHCNSVEFMQARDQDNMNTNMELLLFDCCYLMPFH